MCLFQFPRDIIKIFLMNSTIFDARFLYSSPPFCGNEIIVLNECDDLIKFLFVIWVVWARNRHHKYLCWIYGSSAVECCVWATGAMVSALVLQTSGSQFESGVALHTTSTGASGQDLHLLLPVHEQYSTVELHRQRI